MRTWDQEARRSLSSAVARCDLEQMVEVIADRPVGQVAHLLAPLLIAALENGDRRARPVAIECIPHLEDHNSTDGDRALATRLRQSLSGHESDLRRIPDIDLDVVASTLDETSYDFVFAVNVETGEWKLVSEPDDDVDDSVWLELWNWDSSSEGWQDMADFAGTVDDPELADRLHNAIRGKGAFRRFRDVVYRTDTEQTRWNLFRDERSLGRARAWLASHGFRPD